MSSCKNRSFDLSNLIVSKLIESEEARIEREQEARVEGPISPAAVELLDQSEIYDYINYVIGNGPPYLLEKGVIIDGEVFEPFDLKLIDLIKYCGKINKLLNT